MILAERPNDGAPTLVGEANSQTLRLCPRCAVVALESEGPQGLFHLLEWSVICINTCVIHACPLIQLPRSENSHTAYDFASRVLEHKSVVLVAAETKATMPETPFEAYIRQRIRNGPSKDWLNHLDLTHLHRCCLSLGASLSGHRSVPFLTLPQDEGRRLCELGFKHLIKGPSGLCAALEQSYHKDSSRRPYVSADMGPFYRWLHDVHDDPALLQLVETTRKHIFATYPASPEKEVFGQRPPKQKLYTMADAQSVAQTCCRSEELCNIILQPLGVAHGPSSANDRFRNCGIIWLFDIQSENPTSVCFAVVR